jgi:hypothetical protein
VEVEISFCEIENGLKKELEHKRLLSRSEELVIRKSCRVGQRKPDTELIVHDFIDDKFRNLISKKERELNDLGDKLGFDFTKSGRSIKKENIYIP